MLRSVAALAAALAVLSCPVRGVASVETETAYTKLQTYNAALRYLRVDLGYEVVEKDPDAAYLLFRFAAQGKKAPSNGAIEIVDHRAGERVRVYVRLPELPHFHEQMLSDGLFQKLRNEYGDPPRHDDPPPKDKDKDKDGQGDGKNNGKNDRKNDGKSKPD
jgi:hypothetical protein